MVQEKGLVGKFEANVGDIIKMVGKSSLQGEKYSVCGFVQNIENDSVTLSHEDPSNDPTVICWKVNRDEFGKGDRSFYLKNFDSYQVLYSKKTQ